MPPTRAGQGYHAMPAGRGFRPMRKGRGFTAMAAGRPIRQISQPHPQFNNFMNSSFGQPTDCFGMNKLLKPKPMNIFGTGNGGALLDSLTQLMKPNPGVGQNPFGVPFNPGPFNMNMWGQGVPYAWRRSIPWYNPSTASAIGMGNGSGVPCITDKVETKGIPNYIRLPETEYYQDVNTKLGAYNVNPTWGAPIGQGAFDNASNYQFSGINTVSGMTHTPYDSIYGFPAPLPRNINIRSGEPAIGRGVFTEEHFNIGSGLSHPDMLKALIGGGFWPVIENVGGTAPSGAGIWDWISSFFKSAPSMTGSTGMAPSNPLNLMKDFNNGRFTANSADGMFGKMLGTPNWGSGLALCDLIGRGLQERDCLKEYETSCVGGFLAANICGMGAPAFATHMANYLHRVGKGATPEEFDRLIGDGATRFFKGDIEPDTTGGFIDALWNITKKISPAGLLFKLISGHEFGSGVFEALHDAASDNVGGFGFSFLGELGPLIFGDLKKELGMGVGGFFKNMFSDSWMKKYMPTMDQYAAINKILGRGTSAPSVGAAAKICQGVNESNYGGFLFLLPLLKMMGAGVNGRICRLGMMGAGPIYKAMINDTLKQHPIGGAEDYTKLLDRMATPASTGSWMDSIRQHLTPENILAVMKQVPKVIKGVQSGKEVIAELSKGKEADLNKVISLVEKGASSVTSPPAPATTGTSPDRARPAPIRQRGRGAATLDGLGWGKVVRACVNNPSKFLGMRTGSGVSAARLLGRMLKHDIGAGVGGAPAAVPTIPPEFLATLHKAFTDPNSKLKEFLRPDAHPHNIVLPHQQPLSKPFMPAGGRNIVSPQQARRNWNSPLHNLSVQNIGRERN